MIGSRDRFQTMKVQGRSGSELSILSRRRQGQQAAYMAADAGRQSTKFTDLSLWLRRFRFLLGPWRLSYGLAACINARQNSAGSMYRFFRYVAISSIAASEFRIILSDMTDVR